MTRLLKIYFIVILLSNILWGAENEKPVKLILSADQTHFIRKKDLFYNNYLPVNVPVKVMGIFDDDHSEELTDRVTWNVLEGKVGGAFDDIYVKKGTHTFQASIDGIYSNAITVKVEDNPSPLWYEVRHKERKTELTLSVHLIDPPSKAVKLTLIVARKSGVAFKSKKHFGNHTLRHTMTFGKQEGNPYDPTPVTFSNEQFVELEMISPETTDTITIRTEPLKSDDPEYNGKKLDDIVIDKEEALVLIPPNTTERRGAVRGSRIRFYLSHGDKENQAISLENPPKGMKQPKGVCTQGVPPYLDEVQWDIPLDAEEGKVYSIRAKVQGISGKEQIFTFPITIPKTKPIQTKIEDNELIVIDKDSPLYGMKMKGHNGEDISRMKLRSVAYKDVWRYDLEPLDDSKPVTYTVFAVDNMPEKIDIKFPPYMDTYEKREKNGIDMKRNNENGYLSHKYWDYGSYKDREYSYEGTDGMTANMPRSWKRKRKTDEVFRTQLFLLTQNGKSR